MKSIQRKDINPIKMSVNPPKQIVNADYMVISNGLIYKYVGIGWVQQGEAEREDYKNIPEIVD